MAGAAPAPLTAAALRDLPARPDQRIWLYAVGKAAHGMAVGAVAELRRSLHAIAGGVIVAPESEPSPYSTLRVLAGDHPLPGIRSAAAARAIGETTRGRRGGDIAIVLISGGATSLLAAPLPGLAESDLTRLFALLMDAGLDIGEMNAVRKRFTRWGAGRLALALAPARTLALVVSDVLGDDPADVGSGPCSPDRFAVRDVIESLDRSGLLGRIAPAMRDYLRAVAHGAAAETPKAGHPAFAHVSTRVIGTNALALQAAATRAAALSLRAELVAAPLTGDAALCGATLASTLRERARRGETGCVLWGGETTVAHSDVAKAAGGRCQELALAAARTLAAGGEAAARVTLLAAGTDGRDGPTDAAGAFADAGVWEAIRHRGVDPEIALVRHESHAALDAAGALLRRGPTGTNVMDVVIGLVE